MALQRGDACALQQHRDAAGAGLDDAGLALLHLRDVELDAAHLDAVNAELVLRACDTARMDSSNAFEGMQPAFMQVPPNTAVPSLFFHSSMTRP